MKPTVYLDTNILSTLFYRGAHVQSLAWGLETQSWWDEERHLYVVYGSRRLAHELAHGEYPGKEQALAAVRKLPWLPYRRAVTQGAGILVESGVVPASKAGDAIQLAYATLYRVDYLLTWNQAHLANLVTQGRLQRVCRGMGWRAPLLVSPASIPRAARGQPIGRRDEDAP